ncbi:MAG: tRNA preQ1(34) S-adenosylmethionine ribosyltransferase-isomerase QueA [Myxococcaceae bacterium]|nr:tRNA preQ1(34) S-adenosylmethionine ribosyltransferase-isomerase QueA [Myxococcaceae bacterium]
MRVEDFEFHLPEELIAQAPLAERDASRLLVLNRRSGAFVHLQFRALPELLCEGDLLVFNDTRVIPARLFGTKAHTGGRVELLLVRPIADISNANALADREHRHAWSCLGQASKGLKPGTRVELGDGFSAEIVAAPGGGEVHVRFDGPGPLQRLLDRQGRLPLPPYIRREPTAEDAERYQTLFARVPGSVAAPTASLHFTHDVLERIAARGVRRATVTLDVGPGTFMPVRGDDLSSHKMHGERFEVPEETARAIAETRARGGRVVAVGTTVVRTLETATDPETGAVRPGRGESHLFITPGFRFRQIDALVTNFHLPRSTLLMLVSAFAGHAHARAAYEAAVAERYRFFSYGDAMFISDRTP